MKTSQSALTKKQERRKYSRYEIANAVSINSEGVYQIIDISQGGFRFKCPPHTAIPEDWVTDIINSVIPIEGVSASKVWVSIYENGNTNLPTLMVVGAKFDKLIKKQKVKLMKLLKHISSKHISKDN